MVIFKKSVKNKTRRVYQSVALGSSSTKSPDPCSTILSFQDSVLDSNAAASVGMGFAGRRDVHGILRSILLHWGEAGS